MAQPSRWPRLKSRLLRTKKAIDSRRPQIDHSERCDLLADLNCGVPVAVDPPELSEAPALPNE